MAYGVTLTKNDTRVPLLVKTRNGSGPQDFTGMTGKFFMLDSTDTTKTAESTTGVTLQPTFTFTANATTDRLLATEHSVSNGDEIILSTTTTLPGGLASATRYYAVNVLPGSFQLSDAPNGAPINITSTGSGTHSAYIVGSIQYAWQAGDVDTEGEYRAWLVVMSGGSRSTYPVGDGIAVSVVSRRFGNR
jgi:hypothetical protein